MTTHKRPRLISLGDAVWAVAAGFAMGVTTGWTLAEVVIWT